MANSNNENFKNLPKTEYLWADRKRWLGLPWTFTKYRLSEDRLFLEKGLFNMTSDEILLYRVRDISLKITFGQRIFGVGTVCVMSTDKTVPHLDIRNVKHPREVKELIHQTVEAAKARRGLKPMELMTGADADAENLHEGELDNDMEDTE